MYAVAGRAFGRANLRPIVIACTIMGIIWSLAWTAGAFEDIAGEKQNSELKKLVAFDIVLGSLYAGVAAIELFGLFAAVTRRTSLVRIFVFLSLLVALIVFGAELIRTIVHFSFKSAILEECRLESMGEIDSTSFGFWGGSIHTFSNTEAQQFCSDAFSRNSISTIAWFILGGLLSLFFASIAYSFYRQLLDPLAFRAQAPSDQVRLQAFNRPYGYQEQYGYAPPQQPYGGAYAAPTQAYGGGNHPYPSFAPPPGPPPGAPPYEAGKLPGYGADVNSRDVPLEDEKDRNRFKDGGLEETGGERDPFADGDNSGKRI
ncbi:hypothetical protein BU17DRAFT_63614 [Hysterangium stoloniferum]|nr:hypothetical protein BU17DRAFT_63614 [Hysterangium stoloniferum]